MPAKKAVDVPETVKIGWQLYSIEWLTQDKWPAVVAEAIGVCYSNRGLIQVRLGDEQTPEYNLRQLQETLVHEMLHACFHVSTLHSSLEHPISDEREEYITAMLSGPLLQLMLDNPHVLAWLTQ